MKLTQQRTKVHAARLAIVADTHSAPHPRAYELLRDARPDAILHAGDIGELAVLDALADIAPVHAVRGNIDARAGLPDELVIDLDGRLRIFLTHIAVNGVKLRADVAAHAIAAEASIVICGHSHVPFIGTDKGLTIFNPGSIGPRRFTLPIVFGVLARDGAKLAMHHVSCETGARWLPS
ncbi:MAG TPA: metallophosphoesterase family protein [Kofleriaceae bacterium]|nr:metallophosphoesterase family protein [Kofleriaceae bacterium]